MAIKWSINQLDYEISKDSKSNVVTSVHWDANDSKEVTKDGVKSYTGFFNFYCFHYSVFYTPIAFSIINII